MARFSVAFVALVAPVVLAIPSYPKYGPQGTGPSGVSSGQPISPTESAPYPIGNATNVGPTGTGAGPVGSSTVSIPGVSTSQADNAASDVPAGPGASGVNTSPSSQVATGGSGSGSGNGECGPATVTVTSANTVTVTVGASTNPIVPTPQTSLLATSSAPYGNDTTVAPIGTGSTGLSIPPVSTGSPILPTTTGAAAHGYKHTHLHHYKPASPVAPADSSSSSVVDAPAVFAQSSAPSTTQAAIEVPTPESYQAPSEAPSSPAESAPASTSPASAKAPSGGDVKPRGLVYNTASLASIFSPSAVGWCYNWDSQPGGEVSNNLQFVPMMWGDNQFHTPHWKSNAEKAIEAGSTHLLGFNEPDLPAQANMSPEHATQAWKQYMEQFAGKAKLGSPAVCNGGGLVGNGATMGLNWLNNFLNACSDCTIDFLAIHWYGQANEVENFKNHIGDAQKIAKGKPIWITEFKPDGSAEDQAGFLKEVLPWLDSSESGVERYAVFQVDGVLTSGKSLTPLGDMYNS